MPSFKSLSSIPLVSVNLGPTKIRRVEPEKDYRPTLPKGFSYNKFRGLSYSEPTPKSLEWVCFVHDELAKEWSRQYTILEISNCWPVLRK